MIVQGANDPRVNKGEADQIVVALCDCNYPVQYLLADDEGHGFARPVNNMAMFAAGEKFLAEYIGGRYQESMTPEVTKRLTEITVDPKTVVLKPRTPMNAPPGADLSGKWTMIAQTGGQDIQISLDLKQKGADFAGSLVSHLGPGAVEGGKVSGNNVTGVIKADVQGQPMEITIEGKIEGDTWTGTPSGAGIPALPFTATRDK